jgi:hypothetical protein
MRCPTCSDTQHPGLVIWREVEVQNGVFRSTYFPCPDCGGSAAVSCCDAMVGSWRDATNGDTEPVIESGDSSGGH